MMKIESCATDIDIPQRLRALDMSRVDALAESMAAIGLLQPITVHMVGEAQAEVIAGAHRLMAARKLGWEYIDAVFLEGWSDIDRQLAEIDENLMRSELTPTQQAEHLAKRKELWEAREAAAKTSRTSLGDGRKAGPQHQDGFASETAKATGASKRSVQQSIARATAVPQDIRNRIVGTKLDTGTYLDSLKPLDPEQQRIKVTRDLQAVEDRARASFSEARARSRIDHDVKDRAAKYVAEMIAEHVPGEQWDAVKANLYSSGARNIADALSNITGETLMDKAGHG